MLFGYARISTKEQKLDRQIQSLNQFGCQVIFKDKCSGATTDRPEFKEMIQSLKKGDMVIVHSLDRISRSTVDLLKLVEELKQKGVSLKSIKDSWLDTTQDTAFSDFLLTIMGGLAEFERRIIKERQKEGIEIAKQKGKYKGRPKKYGPNHEGMKHALELYKNGEHTVKSICNITKVSKTSLYRAIKKEGNKSYV